MRTTSWTAILALMMVLSVTALPVPLQESNQSDRGLALDATSPFPIGRAPVLPRPPFGSNPSMDVPLNVQNDPPQLNKEDSLDKPTPAPTPRGLPSVNKADESAEVGQSAPSDTDATQHIVMKQDLPAPSAPRVPLLPNKFGETMDAQQPGPFAPTGSPPAANRQDARVASGTAGLPHQVVKKQDPPATAAGESEAAPISEEASEPTLSEPAVNKSGGQEGGQPSTTASRGVDKEDKSPRSADRNLRPPTVARPEPEPSAAAGPPVKRTSRAGETPKVDEVSNTPKADDGLGASPFPEDIDPSLTDTAEPVDTASKPATKSDVSVEAPDAVAPSEPALKSDDAGVPSKYDTIDRMAMMQHPANNVFFKTDAPGQVADPASAAQSSVEEPAGNMAMKRDSAETVATEMPAATDAADPAQFAPESAENVAVKHDAAETVEPKTHQPGAAPKSDDNKTPSITIVQHGGDPSVLLHALTGGAPSKGEPQQQQQQFQLQQPEVTPLQDVNTPPPGFVTMVANLDVTPENPMFAETLKESTGKCNGIVPEQTFTDSFALIQVEISASSCVLALKHVTGLTEVPK